MTRIWWVRHAPTHARTLAGWQDIPADLSDRAALARLDAHLPRRALITSSDLGRARDTAAALSAGRRSLPADPAFREMHYGQWEGLGFAEVSARWPDLSRAFWEDPTQARPPDGEGWQDCARRVGKAALALARAHPGEDIVIVAHMAAILTQYAAAAGLSAAGSLAQRIDPLSVTCLALEDGAEGPRWTVGCINHVP